MSKDPVSRTKDVRAAVDAELGFDPLVDAADITVRNIAGDVNLTGTVPSYPQYLEAAAATRRVAGSRPTSPCRTAWRRPRRTATSS
jgi:osmotically-inducible protein OsmY